MPTAHLKGRALLRDPLQNKDLAFSQDERDHFQLHGLLPAHEVDLAAQCARAYKQMHNKDSELEKHIFLRNLQDTNEVLFYALITHHIEEMMPLIYTPVVGLGCLNFSHIYRHPRGLFVSYPLRDKMDILFDHACFDNVRVIVVTDGERILGLGDQGANGMGIPIGKLSLYTACAGIHPAHTLPITLDVGTNNPVHLNDPLYIGWHHPRITGDEYNAFIDQFVKTVQTRFPHVLLQWEDFAQQNANPILHRYRDKLCTFNDDIQGTAAVAVGTLLAAVHVTKIPLEAQRIVIFGGGSAGCGISELLVTAMRDVGLSEKDARDRFFIVDKQGLLCEDQAGLLPFQRPFAKKSSDTGHWKCASPSRISLKDVIHHVHPTILIGVSGVAGAFTQDIIEDMAAHVERPIIFPLSNPTSHAEATPSDLLAWTDERALISTGSPFDAVTLRNKTQRPIDQTNNSYIFPGMGLGLIAARATAVTDQMFMTAAKVLAAASPTQYNAQGNLLPPLQHSRKLALQIAEHIALEALSAGLTPFKDEKALLQAVKEEVWEPAYR